MTGGLHMDMQACVSGAGSGGGRVGYGGTRACGREPGAWSVIYCPYDLCCLMSFNIIKIA
jgi:hypothetical protein